MSNIESHTLTLVTDSANIEKVPLQEVRYESGRVVWARAGLTTYQRIGGAWFCLQHGRAKVRIDDTEVRIYRTRHGVKNFTSRVEAA